MSDEKVPSPLAGATPEQLEAWATLVAVVERDLSAESLSVQEVEALRVAADLLRAVAKMERNRPDDSAWGPWVERDETLPQVLAAALLETDR